MKKSQILALVLCFVMLLTACGTTAPAATNPPAAPTTPVDNAGSADNAGSTSADTGVAQPAGYPTKNISWIVPAAAGAAIDLPTRALIDALDVGANVVVENLAGASQTIGALEASVRPADGYTLLTGANAWGIIQPNMNNLDYSPDDFRHIAMMTPAMPSFVAVRPDSELQTVEDLVALIKSGDRFVCGVANNGSYDHLAMTSVLNQLGCTAGECLPYNGSSEVLPAVLSGEVAFGVFNEGDIAPRIKAGELRALCVLSNEASAFFPEIPVIEDYGVTNMSTFKGLKWVAVRKDTPNEIVEWLKVKLNEAIQSEAYQAYLTQAGFGTVREYTEEEVTEIITTANAAYLEVLTELGMAKTN